LSQFERVLNSARKYTPTFYLFAQGSGLLADALRRLRLVPKVG
jgi:hypothetical protein